MHCRWVLRRRSTGHLGRGSVTAGLPRKNTALPIPYIADYSQNLPENCSQARTDAFPAAVDWTARPETEDTAVDREHRAEHHWAPLEESVGTLCRCSSLCTQAGNRNENSLIQSFPRSAIHNFTGKTLFRWKTNAIFTKFAEKPSRDKVFATGQGCDFDSSAQLGILFSTRTQT